MLRLSETYTSFQGEGPNTGKLTQFVRFAGCNFKCPGWACDTPHAIDPKIFTKEQRPYTARDLAEYVIQFRVPHICLTGGEPFLQNQPELQEFITILTNEGATVEVFTNGSLKWEEDFELVLFKNIIMDWKLPGSGEFPDLEVLRGNLDRLGSEDAVKFTVADQADFDAAITTYRMEIEPRQSQYRPVVWCGPVWGKLTSEKLARWIIGAEVPWYLNTQVHKYIWNPDERGV